MWRDHPDGRRRQTPSRSPHPAEQTVRASRPHDSPPGPAPGIDWTRAAPGNPFRPPSWRWELARACAAAGAEGFDPGLDPWVRRALAFQQAASRSEAADPDAAAADVDVAAACRLRAAADPRTRWEAEARLLAREDDSAVAARCGLTPGAVAAYEALFFAVRDRLAQPSSILHLAIGPRLYAAPEDQDLGVVLKLFGYQGGPHVVDTLVGALFGAEPPGCDPRTADLVRLAVGVFFLPTEGPAARLTLRLYLHVLEVEAGAAARAAAPAFAAVAGGARVLTDGPPQRAAPDATPEVVEAADDPAPAPAEPAENGGRDGDDALPPPPHAA
jgi:hypothetical protein